MKEASVLMDALMIDLLNAVLAEDSRAMPMIFDLKTWRAWDTAPVR